MIERALARAYERLGARYLQRALFLQLQLVYAVIIVAVAGLSVYVEMSFGEFVRLALLACAFQFAYSLLSWPVARNLARPIVEWLEGARSDESTIEAWRAAAAFPWETVRRGLFVAPLSVVWLFYLLFSLYFVWELGLPLYSALLVYVASMVLVLYAVTLRFFAVEQVVRPVLRDIASSLPAGAAPEAPGPSLRARLLAVLPAINVITAVVADTFAGGGDRDIADLAIIVLIAAAVAATVSLILTLLLARSITGPIAELREATRRLGDGDFGVRVPVVTTDETGDLARSFNEAAAGLEERERIREAFGTYVDEDVAEHILREGTSLEGEEVEVTMLFLDIRDFTGYAERAEASEVVSTLNRLWECVVPIIHEHGGHVDKFVGDGLLAVFGAPRRQADHAEKALSAALEIDRAVGDEFEGDLSVGIGLNSGSVVAGNVGGAGRLEFSVIGDAVNTAARVEAATRQTGDTILIAERTRELLQGSDISLTERPNVALKGKRESVRLFAPQAGSTTGGSADT
jgi:adenylate cyclase